MKKKLCSVTKRGPNGESYEHGDWIPGCVTSLRYYPDAGAVVAFQIDTGVSIVDDSSDLGETMEQRLATVALGGLGLSRQAPAYRGSVENRPWPTLLRGIASPSVLFIPFRQSPEPVRAAAQTRSRQALISPRFRKFRSPTSEPSEICAWARRRKSIGLFSNRMLCQGLLPNLELPTVAGQGINPSVAIQMALSSQLYADKCE